MDSYIELNGRQYRICDIGEGRCSIIIAYADDTDNLSETYSDDFFALERRIVMDTSSVWPLTIESLSDDASEKLASDTHLLSDVFWLDDVNIKIDGFNATLHRQLLSRFTPRSATVKMAAKDPEKIRGT